jgi:TonB family protein
MQRKLTTQDDAKLMRSLRKLGRKEGRPRQTLVEAPLIARQGKLKIMTLIRTVLLPVISALILTLPIQARARVPYELPPIPDIHCLIVGMTLSNTTDSNQRISGAMLAVFYFGRLDRFSPKDIEDAIAKEAITWTQADAQSEAARCGKELGDKAQSMNEAGKNLMHLGVGLDNEAAPPSDAAPATPPPVPALPPIPTPSTPSASTTPPKLDPNHPLHIGEEYYPVESRRLGEEGTCVLRLQVDVDGYIRATQLLSSTGYQRLNAACLSSFTDARMIPATVGGKPTESWFLFRVNWKLNGLGFNNTPRIRDDYHLKVGPDDYPPLSRKLHQEGDCIVHATVERDGPPSNVTVSKSTGYAPLDQACLTAVQQAQFIAARQQGGTLPGSADINITWRLLSR